MITRAARLNRICRLLAVMAVELLFIADQTGCAQNPAPANAAAVTIDDFYRPDEVQSVYLNIDKAQMQRMQAALPERIFVKASFKWRDVSFENVAVRYKGNSSSAPQQQHKRSFLIKFDEYVDGQRFLGMKRVSLDNGIQFGSVFSEPIITEILRDQKIETHRSNYAKVYLNGKFHGVYVNVERIDETFVERTFPDSKGLLFKVDKGGPGGNLQFIGNDPAMYERAFDPVTKSAKKGRGRLVEFIRAVNETPTRNFAATLDSNLDVDRFLRITAVMLLSGAFDQLTGWNPHNYYLYYDGKQNHWHYLPWDMDVAFCETAFGQIQVLTDWNAAWPAAGQLPQPLMERITTDPVLLQRYRELARSILDKYFEPERLCKVVDAKYELIKQDLRKDPFPHRRVTNPEDRNYDDIVSSIKTFIRKRYTSGREQLENPGERPKMSRPPHGPPAQLVEKIQRIQRAADAMQKEGKDLKPIQKIMQRVGPLLDQNRPGEAEKLVDEVLKLTSESSDKK